ncbi:hypothetical protein FOA52_004994 [Chlamydomonas sp. UWO 241]|nr:hypothetical protein FOA52_004994 [Chlamydomonas sp. UWO 241]
MNRPLPMAAPISYQEVAWIVCDISMDAEPGAQEQAMESILLLHYYGDIESLAAIAAAGVIPRLM